MLKGSQLKLAVDSVKGPCTCTLRINTTGSPADLHQKRREAPAFMPGMDRRWARRAQCPRAQQDLRSTRALNGRGHCIGGSPGIHAGEDVPVLHTHGRNGQYHPHLHLIATSGGYDAQGARWEHLQYLPYDLLRLKWQWHLL